MKRKIIIEIISFLFVLLFLYASFSKLLDYQKFSVQIGQSPLLTGFGDFIPWLVIGSEIVVSIMLITPRLRLIGFYAAFSLMVMFTTYIVLVSRFSDYVPCSCGGVLEGMTWTQHLVFNVAFILFALIAITIHPGIREADSSITSSRVQTK